MTEILYEAGREEGWRRRARDFACKWGSQPKSDGGRCCTTVNVLHITKRANFTKSNIALPVHHSVAHRILIISGAIERNAIKTP